MDARHCGQNEHTRHGGTACRPWNAGSFIAGMVKSGASVYGCCKRDVEVATAWDGNPLPRRGRSWLGAKHDSPGSRREVALIYGL
ncbi:hypothetical protein ACEY8Q_22450 [Salmonella enterica subsp. enterica]|uniref:Uncharacterized protein n=1 Tax=Salmonella enterica subsp. enterica serovar Macclesfield str. S-1643 TaxID=1242107 RepID=A0A241PY55_SALET|nr:hypothetical protein LFZ25_26465 [Salmonella enterica subsp. enterica serovar Macclesfield str. S-1643]